MNPKQIFLAAIEQHASGEWKEFLERICGTDSALKQRVNDLLTAHVQHNAILDDASAIMVEPWAGRLERPGTMIGPYKLLEEIGEGGFGVIFMAEQQSPVRRKVALKVLKPGLDTRQVIARFEAERQVLALMEHPNIAHVLDAGEAPSGRPYFVMELVKGKPITAYCDQQRLPLHGRLELFIDVCHAIQHAHLKGIIHRDLKPSNILVAQCDGQPIAKVIDFGIAKATGQMRLTDKTLFTGFSQFIGTPAYMSPEQAANSPVDVDTRSDVYSLGVLLYEILTGRTPLDSEELSRSDYDEMRRIIREVEPLPPSTRISSLKADALETVADHRGAEPSNLRQHFKRDLDWIVAKSLDKDRARRYQSASALAADIERFLKNEPVEACPPSKIYRLTKFSRRNRFAIATASMVIGAMLTGTLVSLWQASEANKARRMTDSSLVNEKRARQESLESERNLRRQLYASDTADAWRAWNNGDIDRTIAVLDRYLPTPGKEDLREFGWKFLNARCHYQPITIVGHEAPILCAAVAPNSRHLASGDRAGNVKVWESDSGRQLESWRYSDQEVTTVAFSPDGTVLATAGQDRTIRLWKSDDWTELACLRGHKMTVCCVSWSPDGKWLASSARDQSVRIWDTQTMREVKCIANNQDVLRSVLWSKDGTHLIAADGPTVRFWRTQDWMQVGVLEGYGSDLLALSVSPDGRLLAAGGYGEDVIVYDLHAMREVSQAASVEAVWSLSFSPDGRHLLAGTGRGGPMAWRVQPINSRLELVRGSVAQRGRQRATLFVDDETIVTASEEGQCLDVLNAREVLGLCFDFPRDCLAVALQQDLAITAQPDGTIVIRRFSNNSILAELEGHTSPVQLAAVSQSGNLLATSASDGDVFIWELRSFTQRQRLAVAAPIAKQLAFSPNEERLAAASNEGPARIWQIDSGIVLKDLHVESQDATRIAYSPDGQLVATSSISEKLIVFRRAADLELVHSIRVNQPIWDIQFSPDSAQLIAAGELGAVVYDVTSRREVIRLLGHRGQVKIARISPDGQTLATTGSDRTLRLWHLPTGRELFRLASFDSQPRWLAFANSDVLFIGAERSEDSRVSLFKFDARTNK